MPCAGKFAPMAVSALLAATLLTAAPACAQQMAITFDDLPAHGGLPPGMTRLDVTQSILKTLEREHMPPTYGFINAAKVANDPQTLSSLNAWRDAGQPLGSHTWSHPELDQIAAAEFESEIAKNEPMLTGLAARNPQGQDWRWFRYPFLEEGDTVEKHRAVRAYLTEHGYRIAEVSIDFEDYLWNNPYARCVKQHDTTAIARLHDTYLATATEYTRIFRLMTAMLYGHDIRYVLLMHVGAFDAKMLPELLELYRSQGFTFISLPEAMADPVYAEDPDIGIRYGGTQIEAMMVKRKLKFPHGDKPVKELDSMCR